MAKYSVYAKVSGSKFLGEFEAESEEEAIELAEKSGGTYISLCHQCSDECEDAECEELVAQKE